MSKRKFNEEERDVQDINEVENVQVEETIEGHTHESVSSPEVSPEVGSNPDQDDDRSEDPATPDESADAEQDTFDRAYVEKLRKESAKYREKAKRTEELEHRLHTALVAADGRLADPEDLPFTPEHLDDPEALTAAVTNLVKNKPGLRSRKFTGDVGAGDRGSKHKAPVDLLQIMKSM